MSPILQRAIRTTFGALCVAGFGVAGLSYGRADHRVCRLMDDAYSNADTGPIKTVMR